MYNQFEKVSVDTPLIQVSKILDHDHFVIVTKGWQSYTEAGELVAKDMVFGTLPRIDLVNYIMTHDSNVNGDLDIDGIVLSENKCNGPSDNLAKHEKILENN